MVGVGAGQYLSMPTAWLRRDGMQIDTGDLAC
jgi:hypothetical protein